MFHDIDNRLFELPQIMVPRIAAHEWTRLTSLALQATKRGEGIGGQLATAKRALE
jgi:hypothetical protein